MDALSIACLKYEKENEHSISQLSTGGPGYVITNETYTTVVSYKALKGVHFLDVPTGSTITRTYSGSISISAGELIQGVTITAGLSESVAYSVSGPADGTTLSNGKPATHRTAIGVLYGSVSRYEYDVILTDTGTVRHMTEYVITPNTKSAVPYTMLVNIGMPTYIQKPTGTNWIVVYNTPTAFYNAIVSSPSDIV